MNDNNWNQPLVIQPKPNTQTGSVYSKPKSSLSKKIFISLIILVVIAALVYFGINIFQKYKFVPKEVLTPQEVSQVVGKIVLLPTDEEPKVQTISDLQLVSGQLFFKNALVGDQLITYPNIAKKAILYRPSTNQIIEMATLQ